MKKTQFIDFLTTIKKTMVSFLAITVFIALGLAFYGGSLWSIQHTEQSLTKTYNDAKARTLIVSYPFGVDEEHIAQLEAIEGIDEAEGCNIVYRFFYNNEDEKQLAAIVQVSDNIDQLINIEGQLPTVAGEAAVLRCWAIEHNVSIGDVISLQEENGIDYRKYQSVKKIAESDKEHLLELELSSDDPGYLVKTNLTITAIVDSAVYLSTNPHAHGICSDNGLYIDSVFFVSEEEMPSQVFNGYTSILLFSEQLNQMSSFSDEYKQRSQQLSEAVQTVLEQWDKEIVEDVSDTVDEIRAQLDDYYNLTGISFVEGENLYQTLLELRDDLVQQGTFGAVMETDSNNSFLVADNLLNVLASLRYELGITFLAIGVLICYSVISRLVADSAVQIGTRKALGFYRKEILRLYLSYVASAILIGAILGVLIGVYGIEFGFVSILASQFTFSNVPLVCNLIDILPVFFILSGIILVVTFLACNARLNKNAITLLQGAHEEIGNHDFILKSKLFHKLSKLNQTIVLNLIKDKRRVFGMITGIAGSAALMVAGLSFYFNFTTAFPKQFEDYYHFDYQINFNSSSSTACQQIRQILDDYGLDYAEICTSCFIMDTPDGKTNAPNYIVASSNEELAKIMNFSIETNELVNYDDGVWMSDYYCYSFDAPIGTELQLETLNGKKASLAVEHYYKYHLSTPVIVMTPQIYQEAFLEEAISNAFYVNLDGLDVVELNEKLEQIDGYIYTINVYESFSDSFESEKLVVVAFASLFIIMAVLMALMTIINLLNVYISEKKNELIILMINGYDRKYAKQYIYQDTIVLTMFGILIGIIFGNFMAEETLIAVEGTTIRMLHGIHWLSCLVASAATMVLILLVCKQSLRRVDKFRLSDIDMGK